LSAALTFFPTQRRRHYCPRAVAPLFHAAHQLAPLFPGLSNKGACPLPCLPPGIVTLVMSASFGGFLARGFLLPFVTAFLLSFSGGCALQLLVFTSSLLDPFSLIDPFSNCVGLVLFFSPRNPDAVHTAVSHLSIPVAPSPPSFFDDSRPNCFKGAFLRTVYPVLVLYALPFFYLSGYQAGLPWFRSFPPWFFDKRNRTFLFVLSSR